MVVNAVQAKSNIKRRNDGIILILLGAVFVVVLLSIFGPTWYIVQQNEVMMTTQQQSKNELPIEMPTTYERTKKKNQETYIRDEEEEFPIPELNHEEQFHSTIKSCLPYEKHKSSQKCGEYIPVSLDDKKIPIQRVALIAPPGDLSLLLLNRIEETARIYNEEHRNVTTDPEIQIIVTTHVPPYGYGKTHGITKIIRLVSKPILIQVLDALYHLLQQQSDPHSDNNKNNSQHATSYTIITLDDIKQAFRQIMRFHCRLSHVAAHTAIYSILLVELLKNPIDVSKKLKNFLIHSNNNNTSEKIIERKQKEEDQDGEKNDDDESSEEGDDVLLLDDDGGTYVDEEIFYGSKIIAHIQKQIGLDKNLSQILDQVLVDEIKLTKNFTKWPCEPFWSPQDNNIASSRQQQQHPPLSKIIQELAKALSPDCNDPYVKCWVPRDLCEAAGDPVCAK